MGFQDTFVHIYYTTVGNMLTLWVAAGDGLCVFAFTVRPAILRYRTVTVSCTGHLAGTISGGALREGRPGRPLAINRGRISTCNRDCTVLLTTCNRDCTLSGRTLREGRPGRPLAVNRGWISTCT